MLQLKEIAPLTDDERLARNAYVSDARFIHLSSQGYSRHVGFDSEFIALAPRLAGIFRNLDSAIAKYELEGDAVVYSGHGNQLATLGSIWPNEPASLVGLSYRYRGFISTSVDRGKAENFARTGAADGQFAILMEIRLPKGFNLLDMTHQASGGEFEYLIGRKVDLEIISADWTTIPQLANDVLHLILQPQ